ERMSQVDRNILRIAVYEMLHGEDAPVQVAINEALEVAKRYSIDESVPFINGILDAVQSRVAG
ncbi:MAG: transcription antitermination protein NusB, partial [Desulfobulbaceae bacterium]|nr:transcription antitermination protein NusB [Desulfobulbaceae bacterium]